MYSRFIGACLMGVALSLNIKNGLELEELTLPFTPAEEPFFSLAQTDKFSEKVC